LVSYYFIFKYGKKTKLLIILDTPIVTLPQLIIGFFLIVFGYTIANLMSFTIYSKMLGPWPQGTMMGVLTGVGSLARALGPIVVSILYSGYGPRISLIFLISLITSALILLSLTYKRFKEYVYNKDLEA
jgi:ceroid-lipofuscinosis MFS transporter 7